MIDKKIYPILQQVGKRPHISEQQYQDLYQQSLQDPEKFWAEQAEKFVSWFTF